MNINKLGYAGGGGQMPPPPPPPPPCPIERTPMIRAHYNLWLCEINNHWLDLVEWILLLGFHLLLSSVSYAVIVLDI